ncbi:MAG: nuclear transport factor 2 family protein [Candidatus Eisenbacteria bacterium]|uniref:Nuclear transport factor 2 family protein n=1 Tax=Eiseniibacteriota bacterium TaxID=2212470 RepID=A0A7Y2H2B9_UNCEI|nr:nuclear transport factor 2 family protein [Candidatus Eisenbacteria bacterium]
MSLPDELARVLRDYEVSWAKSDAAGLAALFTEDGYVLRPGRSPVHGREAILAAYKNSGGPLALKAYAYETEGNVGYIIGGYSTDPKSPEVGKFVLAIRRDDSGKWFIVADIDNGN